MRRRESINQIWLRQQNARHQSTATATNTEYIDKDRGTGRTTGRMIQAIGQAVENGGREEIEFINHERHDVRFASMACYHIARIAATMGMQVKTRLGKGARNGHRVYVQAIKAEDRIDAPWMQDN